MSGLKTVIGVPVRWESRVEVTAGILEGTGGRYLFAGTLILEIATKTSLILEIQPHEERLRDAFAAAGYGRIEETTLDAVAQHRQCLYLVDEASGSIEAARRGVRFVDALLEAGGIAPKVESSGKAHDADAWRAIAADVAGEDEGLALGSLHEAFVTLVGNEAGEVYSCGMHHLGLPDAIAGGVPTKEAAETIRAFGLYLAIESPTIADGQTFARGPEAPAFRCRLEPCLTYPEDDLFHNPFGMWRLSRRPPLDQRGE